MTTRESFRPRLRINDRSPRLVGLAAVTTRFAGSWRAGAAVVSPVDVSLASGAACAAGTTGSVRAGAGGGGGTLTGAEDVIAGFGDEDVAGAAGVRGSETSRVRRLESFRFVVATFFIIVPSST